MNILFNNKKEFIHEYQKRMLATYGRDIASAHFDEIYYVLGTMIRDYASSNWKESKTYLADKKEKQMYYFSMEFLMGRLLTNNLMNLGIYDIVNEGLNDLGIDLNMVEKLESDAGLGNGGLGRLAACFLDSLTSSKYPGNGNCIRYEYGFFQQCIENDEQVEVPDRWLRLGNVWEIRKPKNGVDINFFGRIEMYFDYRGKAKVRHIDPLVIRAIPYDVPVVGANTALTNTLRLWSAECADEAVDYSNFENYIVEVREINHSLYPDDSTEKGRYLRLKQQYFFVAAGISSIIDTHLRTYHSLDNLAEKVSIQLNDTHPVLCIPELMRILMDVHEYDWDVAWNITKNVMSYTNHTVLSEALEKWPIHYVQTMLPRIYMIIEEINNRYIRFLAERGKQHLQYNTQIIKDGQIHMANLAIIGSHKVNGVAYLHTEILKEDVFKEFHELYPTKLLNKTNGITHRRWLLYSNPQLTKLLESKIGDSFKTNPDQLEKLMDFVEDSKLQKDFLAVKLERKKILAKYISDHLDIEIDLHSIIDVQAKRLHAYKRQLLNVMHIIYLYQQIKSNPEFTMHPRTFIFSAKAAPSYYFAKKVIKLINRIAHKVNNDPSVSRFMKVVFIPNYSVSIAEILLNAADVSEQISLAGKEASGTGNMKFMMNGAITLGTLDGANVEIVERVGHDNAVIFGLQAHEVASVKQNYNAVNEYNNNGTLKAIIDSFVDGTWDENPNEFKVLYDELLFKNDEYLLLKDFEAYKNAQSKVEKLFESDKWAKICLVNIAKSGYFSSDRTIDEYAKEIWNIKKVNI